MHILLFEKLNFYKFDQIYKNIVLVFIIYKYYLIYSEKYFHNKYISDINVYNISFINLVQLNRNWLIKNPRCVLTLSSKECNYTLCADKSNPRLTKFLVNIIRIYDSKLIYYENTFRN